MSMLIGLDFETYGACNLPTHGLDRYVSHPTFRVTLAGISARLNTSLLDFVLNDYDVELRRLHHWISGPDVRIAAHNAGFEQAVLQKLGLPSHSSMFIDSAVVARAAGAESRLEVAAPQLLDADKMEEGRNLIKLFAVPGKLQEANGSDAFDPDIVELYPEEWETFGKYCKVDAMLGLQLVQDRGSILSEDELKNMHVTADMNLAGWHVDLDTVHEMKRRYEANTAALLAEFRATYDPDEKLNFNSFPQQKEWCAARGVRANSFDELNVEKMLKRIHARIAKGGLTQGKYDDLLAVQRMLETKQALGGSSLKKLQTIINRTGEDGRLRHEYVHIGAGQTWRCSGKGVQMQNLKRLHGEVDMAELEDETVEWNNQTLAANVRQVFTAEDPDGFLIVGDLASIESRKLAWLSGAEDKLEAFRHGLDVYKVLAAKMYKIHYGDVLKDQRQFGKVGELSCGYQAAGPAVKAFAAKMGVELSEAEAAGLVTDWRDANPDTVDLWARLDAAFKEALLKGAATITVADPTNWTGVHFEHIRTPRSITDLHPGAQSMSMELIVSNVVVLKRVFHGCYLRGRNVGYYKPTSLKNGDLWKNHFRDPKTKEIRFFQLYGGKLAGILTQSSCRELFYMALQRAAELCKQHENLMLIAQFHDEIVLEWKPAVGGISLEDAKTLLHDCMTMASRMFGGLPLDAEIKHDYRYTK